MVCCHPGRRKGIDQSSTFSPFLFIQNKYLLIALCSDKNPYNAMVDRLDRKRTSIAAPEKRSLEAYFAVQPRPSGEKIAAIAEKLDLKKNVVRVWFCNQRQKQKRMKFAAQGGIHQVSFLSLRWPNLPISYLVQYQKITILSSPLLCIPGWFCPANVNFNLFSFCFWF